MSDDYLARLKDIERRINFKEGRRSYKLYRDSPDLKSTLQRRMENTLRYLREKKSQGEKLSPMEVLEARALAYQLLTPPKDKTHYDIDYALGGARIYEELGIGYKAVPKLVRYVEEISKHGDRYEMERLRREFYPIKSFIERNAKQKRDQKESGLEARVGVFIFITLAGIVLSISSLTATGNVIANLTGTTKGVFGLILFVVGLVGLFLTKRYF
ncbi:MAG: hypothetical protein KatS3mg001_474 [Candidatus Pacearchaeota archaeon]|nr:MAG: hypothetical protein KatS3mg001_474 [Candidatus Pacearchaeota archaeon]